MSGPAVHPHPLAAVLAGVHAGSCPGELNFHCHTLCSDGSLVPERLGEQAVALGLRHLAVTDHHSTAALAPLRRWLAAEAERGEAVPTLWSGMEISCLLEGCLVHVLALGFDETGSEASAALAPYRQGSAPVGEALRAGEVVRRIHGAGGLALLAHPARYRLPFARLINAAAELGLDGGEAWYDYAMQPRWQPTPLVCESIAAQLEGLGLLRSCGTDTHGLELHGR
ncbi:PHP domain-containing protein [Vulcanococcus limneticus]|uniref:PHP domain-containing protein n=1 Tax=Vulcanococcus limneticus TaxID=2170428 RepID=UPI00398C248A